MRSLAEGTATWEVVALADGNYGVVNRALKVAILARSYRHAIRLHEELSTAISCELLEGGNP